MNETAFMDGDEAGLMNKTIGALPTVIEKQVLDNVVLIAAGRYHTIAIRKQNEGDMLKMEADEDEEEEANDDNDDPQNIPEPTKDGAGKYEIRHEVYAWGRGYHGQLGLKNMKMVQL